MIFDLKQRATYHSLGSKITQQKLLDIGDSLFMWLLVALIAQKLGFDVRKITEGYACRKNHFVFIWSMNNSVTLNIRCKVSGIGEYDHLENYDRSFIVSSFICRYALSPYFDVYHINEQKHWTDADKKMFIDLSSYLFWKDSSHVWCHHSRNKCTNFA